MVWLFQIATHLLMRKVKPGFHLHFQVLEKKALSDTYPHYEKKSRKKRGKYYCIKKGEQPRFLDENS